MLRAFLLIVSHVIMLTVGFGLGVYTLPILTAPPGPDRATLEAARSSALYNARFRRDLAGSDFLHWGEGDVRITARMITHEGKLAPGPDYKLYLATEFVENEEQFEKIKSQATRVGDIKTFDGFVVDIPDGIDVNAYTTVVVWCEAFSEFITAAKYR